MKDIPASYVLDKLQIPYDNTKSNFNITCPCCGTEKKLNVNLVNGFFRCAKCDISGNPVHLFAALTNRPIWDKEAAREDGTYRKMKDELLGGAKSMSDIPYKPVIIDKKDVNIASEEVRAEAYRELLGILSLSDLHYNNLVRRGLRECDIIENEYRTAPENGLLPAKTLREKGVLLKGVPGFYYENEVWRIRKMPGMFVPARSIPEPGDNRIGNVKGIQIRSDKKNTKCKYVWLSSIDMEMGAQACADCHFVGFPENTIRLTEGPLKADIIYRFTEVPVLAIPGVNSQDKMKEMLPVLWGYGVRRIKTCFDMDYLINENVQKAYFKLLKTLQEFGFEVEREIWDKNFKGLDDFLLHAYLSRGGKLDTMK